MKSLRLSALVFGLLLAPAVVHAQVLFPDGKAPDGTFETDGFGTPITAWCTFDGYEPLTEPKLGARVVPDKRLAFLQPAFVIRTHKIDRGQAVNVWYLLGALNSAKNRVVEYYGWIKQEHCLVGRECLKTEHGIFRKAMLVNPYELDDATKERIARGEDVSVPLFKAPASGAHRVEGLYPWFSFFFVFGESDGYLLLGSSPTFDADKVSSVLKGWVRRDNVCRWDTREAYHWDRESTAESALPRRTRPVIAYHTPDQAWQMLRQARRKKVFPPFPPPDPPEATDPIHIGGFVFEQFDDRGVSRELQPYEPRFPNLGYEGDVLFPSKDRLTNMRLLRIGCIGGVGKFSPAELAKIRRDLNALLVEASTLEIVFLIDDTLSMKKWFDVVSSTVRQIREDVVTEFATGIEIEDSEGVRRQLGQVRVAVSYYNDLQAVGPNKGKHVPLVGKLQDIDKKGVSIAKALHDHPSTKDLVENNRELLYDGLEKAVRGSGFSSAARRILILLGDFGDVHAKGDSHAKGSARILEAYSPNPIEFYPIQVVDRNRVKHSDYDAFAAQMQSTVDAVNRDSNAYRKDAVRSNGIGNEIVKARFFAVDESAAQQPAEQVSQFVLSRFREQKRQIAELQAEIRRLIHGDWHTKISFETLEKLKERNFPVDDLVGKRGTQMFEEGYVWAGSGLKRADGTPVPQVRLWALMNRREVETLKNTLFAISSEGRASPEALAAAVAEQIQALSGDTTVPFRGDGIDRRKLSVELSKKIPGLESLIHSQLLTQALGNANFGELRDSELVEIHRCALRLDDILKNRKVVRREAPVPGSVLPDFIVTSSTPFSRVYEIPDSPATWYWIDVEKELP